MFNGKHYYNIELTTSSDTVNFVKAVADEPGEVKLVDGNGCCVNGKSLLGAIATIEWATLYCISDNDIYFKIKEFCVGEMKSDVELQKIPM